MKTSSILALPDISTGETKILPSPGLPVLPALQMTFMAASSSKDCQELHRSACESKIRSEKARDDSIKSKERSYEIKQS